MRMERGCQSEPRAAVTKIAVSSPGDKKEYKGWTDVYKGWINGRQHKG